MNENPIVFTFANAELNKLSQNFIKVTELLTGKITLKKLYDQYLEENNPPENFWQDAIKKLKLDLVPHFHHKEIPKKGRLIVVANHAFGVVDGVSICSIISKVRYDYKMITHKVLRQADAVKEKIIPIDFSSSKEARINNLNARKLAEKFRGWRKYILTEYSSPDSKYHHQIIQRKNRKYWKIYGTIRIIN